jgi:isoquinoline 1-oxidoreductase
MTDELTRRELLSLLGAGLLVAIAGDDADGQLPPEARDERGGVPARPPQSVATRLHLSPDGTITVMSGKVECGQGVRAQITQAAAEELHVSPAKIQVLLGDTDLCPDDGPTVGSRSTSRTIPSVRQGAAAAREVLIGMAAEKWGVGREGLTVRDGVVLHSDGRRISYGELAGDAQAKAFTTTVPGNGVQVTPVKEWKVLGAALARPNGRDIVTGAHRYPSVFERPNMLHGKVLRPPRLGATLAEVDLKAAGDVVVTRDGNFLGVAAPSTARAREAIEALRPTTRWVESQQTSSKELFEQLRKTAQDPSALVSPFAKEPAAQTVRREYRVAYVQHAPLEPRAAVAEWEQGKLTVWTATQNPTRVREELAAAFSMAVHSVRVIVPDFGGGFGGKHTGETAVEAARLAKAAGRPVSVRWTREEEFQWASFRPAALIVAEAGLNADGSIASWMFTNVNSGAAGLKSPYRAGKKQEKHVECASPPLRHGSYRGLAATANHFAREAFIDELAAAAGSDPLAWRLAHLDEPRVVNVLKAVTEGFGWAKAYANRQPNIGVGLACGTEKGSFVAACAEIAIDPASKSIRVTRVRQAFECGTIQNPSGLLAQVQGAIVQGLGPALWEAIAFDGGQVTNGSFAKYRVPRFSDVPAIEVDLLDRPDLTSIGAGETPIVAIAPAIANAVFHATGKRCFEMPIQL